MLLQITNKCLMNCTHCLAMSTEDGPHMGMDVVGKALQFIRDIDPNFLMITGGEPTLHPYFLDIYDACVAMLGDSSKILIASNGMFADDEKLVSEMIKRGMQVQITNDTRYYPKRIKKYIIRTFDTLIGFN